MKWSDLPQVAQLASGGGYMWTLVVSLGYALFIALFSFLSKWKYVYLAAPSKRYLRLTK